MGGIARGWHVHGGAVAPLRSVDGTARAWRRDRADVWRERRRAASELPAPDDARGARPPARAGSRDRGGHEARRRRPGGRAAARTVGARNARERVHLPHRVSVVASAVLPHAQHARSVGDEELRPDVEGRRDHDRCAARAQAGRSLASGRGGGSARIGVVLSRLLPLRMSAARRLRTRAGASRYADAGAAEYSGSDLPAPWPDTPNAVDGVRPVSWLRGGRAAPRSRRPRWLPSRWSSSCRRRRDSTWHAPSPR